MKQQEILTTKIKKYASDMEWSGNTRRVYDTAAIELMATLDINCEIGISGMFSTVKMELTRWLKVAIADSNIDETKKEAAFAKFVAACDRSRNAPYIGIINLMPEKAKANLIERIKFIAYYGAWQAASRVDYIAENKESFLKWKSQQ